MDNPADGETKKMPAASIAICTKNRRRMTERLVSAIQHQTAGHDVEIVVLEENDDVMEPIPGVIYQQIPSHGKGFGFARNTALGLCRGELVVFVDDDCEVQAQWFETLVAPFQDSATVAVQGGVLVPEGTNATGICESLLGFPGGGIYQVNTAKGENIEIQNISTLNSAYRISALAAAGGFDEKLIYGGEDFKLAKDLDRFGKKVFCPKAAVYHRARGSLPAIFNWFIRRGRAEVGLAKTGWESSTFYIYWARNSILLKLAVISVFGLIFGVTATVITGFLCLYYLKSFLLARKRRKDCQIEKSVEWLLPVVKMVMDIGIDVGRIREVVAFGTYHGNHRSKE